jgi:hypothetical protein
MYIPKVNASTVGKPPKAAEVASGGMYSVRPSPDRLVRCAVGTVTCSVAYPEDIARDQTDALATPRMTPVSTTRCFSEIELFGVPGRKKHQRGV